MSTVQVPPHIVDMISTLDDAGLQGALSDLAQKKVDGTITNPAIAVATIDCILDEQRRRA